MKHTAYQIGVLRDTCGEESNTSIFDLSLDVINWAKNIRDSYNSPSSLDVRFDELNITAAASLSYAIWHAYSKVEETQNALNQTYRKPGG
jgi:hypothetical protein